jgi:hypothetical protein
MLHTYVYMFVYKYIQIYIYIYICIYTYTYVNIHGAAVTTPLLITAAANHFMRGCVVRLALHEEGGALGRAHEPMICRTRHVRAVQVLQLPRVHDAWVRDVHFDVRGEVLDESGAVERDPSEAAACLAELSRVVLLWASGRAPSV